MDLTTIIGVTMTGFGLGAIVKEIAIKQRYYLVARRKDPQEDEKLYKELEELDGRIFEFEDHKPQKK